MSWRDYETTQKTMESYNLALEKLTKICPKLEPSCNESNNRTVLPTRYIALTDDKKTLIKYCTYVHCNVDELFEYGRPKIINASYWVWNSNYLGLECGIEIPFDIYCWEPGESKCLERDGSGECIKWGSTPSKIKPFCSPQTIKLDVFDGVWNKCWGLKNWYSEYKDILGFMDDANDSVKIQYRNSVEKANEQVLRWENEIRKLSEIQLPV